MVLQSCKIYFTDVNKGAYFGGDTVSGTVSFSLVNQKKLKDLTFNAKGETRCSWTERESTGVGKDKTTRTVRYSSHEVHFRAITSLLGRYARAADGQVLLQPGQHTFPFSFRLPSNVPTSLERRWGRVRYTIKITAVRSMRFDDNFRMPFSVISRYDLNTNPSCGVQVTRRIQKSFNFLFVTKGAMTVVVTLPVRGFVPGQDITMNCEIRNPSKVNITGVKFSLVQRTTFVCTYPRRKTKVELSKIVEYAGKGAHKGEEINYPVRFKVPALPPSTIGQHLITDEYFLKVKAFCDGMHMNPSELIPVAIGTIPLNRVSSQGYYNAPSTSAARPYDRTASLPYNPTAPLPFKPTAPLPYKPTAPLPFKPTAPLPYKPTAPLPYTPTTPLPTPSAPPQTEMGLPPSYDEASLPTYEESQFSQMMSEADPEDEDGNVPFSPVYPVYRFPPVNTNYRNIHNKR